VTICCGFRGRGGSVQWDADCGGRHNHKLGKGTARRTNSRMVMLPEGTQIECHASFNFPRHVFLKMKQEDKHTLKRKRTACCRVTFWNSNTEISNQFSCSNQSWRMVAG
jgi:hypothetical protein